MNAAWCRPNPNRAQEEAYLVSPPSPPATPSSPAFSLRWAFEQHAFCWCGCSSQRELLSKPSTSVHHPPAAMENLLSAAASHSTLPDSFVFLQEHRPPASSAVVALPVIVLSAPRDVVRHAVLEADRELGFFQVNHGMPEQAVRDMEANCKAFFRLPAEDKAAFYSDDTARPNRLFTSTTHGAAGEHYWRDCLRLICGTFPVAVDTKDAWPVPTSSSHGVLVATGSAMKETPQKIRVGVVGLTRCNS